MGLRTSCGVLEGQVEVVREECLEITKTLRTLGDALQSVTTGAGGQEWAGFGLVSLPIVASLRAMRGIASQYVSQQTGLGLGAWTDFVASAGAQFEGYVEGLAVVGEVAQARRAGPAGQAPDPGSGPSEHGDHEIEVLRRARQETEVWKLVLTRVAQLGQVVDAILQVEIPAEPEHPDTSPEAPGGFGGLQRRLKDVQHRTIDRSGDLRQAVLHPFLDVRDRALALPGQVDLLSQDVGLLQVIMELVEAELGIDAGHLTEDVGRVVRLRVAAAVLLPELARRLTLTRSRIQDLEGYLTRLHEAARAGHVGEQVCEILRTDYQSRLESEWLTVRALEGEAATWRRDGETVILACQDWVGLELDLLDARRRAGEPDPSSGRTAVLQRERDRLAEARELLDGL